MILTKILAAPYIHLNVIRTKVVEVLTIDYKKASGNHRSPIWCLFVFLEIRFN